MNFTFLFVTKGRYDFDKSLVNCLEQIQKFSDLRIIIIDGNKDNRVQNFLGDQLFLKNLKVIKQKKGRFVRACLIGIENLETDFFTFMHDDDYISPNFYKLIKFAIKNNTSVIGNGIVLPKENMNYVFPYIENFQKIDSRIIINKYFCSKKINGKFLPANPASIILFIAQKYWTRFIIIFDIFKYSERYLLFR